jgi:uncharacterized membrane protein YgcG
MKSRYLAATIFLILLLPVLFAAEFPKHYNDYVNDYAKIFNVNQTSELTSLLSQVRIDSTAEVVVVTVNNVSDSTPQQYATGLLSEWGVGKADKDNGLVILYAKAENKIWIATGYGLEGILPDSKLGRLLDEYYVPLRDEGRVTEGIIAVTQQIAVVIEENKVEIISGQTSNNNSNNAVLIRMSILAIIALILIVLGVKAQKKKNNKAYKWISTILFFLGFIIFMGLIEASFDTGYGYIPLILVIVVILYFRYKSYKSKKIKESSSKKKNYGSWLNIASILFIFGGVITGLIFLSVIGIILIIILRIIGRSPSSPWYVPMGSGGGFSGGGFGGGGFGGGGGGGGGAGR